VTYDEFRDVWTSALRESGLRIMHQRPTETLDLNSTARRYTVYLEPAGRQDAAPFFVAAEMSWRWDALLTARTDTSEGDLLTELLGRKGRAVAKTEPPWLRMDIGLKASLTMGQEIPMPPSSVWATWALEVVGRLNRIERLLPLEVMTEQKDGPPLILAWQGEPSLAVACSSEGKLKLSAVEIAAWQAINLPRVWSGGDHRQDEHPHEQLEAMFKRVRASLNAWMESLDHLAREPKP
jgi:hypothetical protein